MQKLDQSISHSYQPLILWPDQLTEILEIIAPCTDISVVADNVKYDSVVELVKESKGRSPKRLEVQARNPHLTIELNPLSSRLYVSSSELIATGLSAKLDTLLRSCERRPKLLYRFVSPLVASLALPNLLLLPPLKVYTWMSLPVSLVTFAWILAVFYMHFRKHTTIQTVLREHRRTFWNRNRDAIVVALVSALLGAVGGAVGGAVATKLADRFWPSASSALPVQALPPSQASTASK